VCVFVGKGCLGYLLLLAIFGFVVVSMINLRGDLNKAAAVNEDFLVSLGSGDCFDIEN
jgi:hypothetical protein